MCPVMNDVSWNDWNDRGTPPGHQYPISEAQNNKTTNPHEDLLEFLNNRFDRDYVEPNVACFFFPPRSSGSSWPQLARFNVRVSELESALQAISLSEFRETVCRGMKSQNYMKILKSYETRYIMSSKLGKEFINQSFQNIAPATFVVEMFLFLFIDLMISHHGRCPKGQNIRSIDTSLKLLSKFQSTLAIQGSWKHDETCATIQSQYLRMELPQFFEVFFKMAAWSLVGCDGLIWNWCWLEQSCRRVGSELIYLG